MLSAVSKSAGSPLESQRFHRSVEITRPAIEDAGPDSASVTSGSLLGAGSRLAQELGQDAFQRRDSPSATVKSQLRVTCLLYTSPSPRDGLLSRMPSSA